MYDSWASRIRLFIKGKKNGRMMLDSIDNGPLVYPTVEENGQTRPKKYSELTEAQQLQDKCDVQEQISFFTEWSKFVTDVKLEKSLYTTNYAQLYAYLSQHERHANEVRIMRERYPDPLALATIQDRRVTVQQVQRRQTQSFAGTRNRGIATTSRRNYASGQAKVVKCYNCLRGRAYGETVYSAKEAKKFCIWFKEKLMLAEAQEAGQILDEEQLAFIADPVIAEV
ncbi:hypothetical protein Tco_0026266 [Tanacetum coccineum]